MKNNNEEILVPFKMSGQNPELVILSQAIATSDDLVRKVQSLVQENRKLKQKYRSLSQSAVQVKHLYEQERDMCLKVKSQNTELKNKIAGLMGRNSQLDHSLINMQLTHSQAIAELEMKNNQETTKSNNILKDLIFQCKDWTEGDAKFKGAIRQAIDLLDKRGVDVEKLILTRPRSRRKGRQKKDEDSMSVSSETCSSIFEDIETNQFPDTSDSLMAVSFSDKTEIKIRVQPTIADKVFISTETNTETKTYCDKSTTYISSTTTRGVSTEGFIKTFDVGTIFPEPTTLSIKEIFKEMIIDMPRLLSPLPEDVLAISWATQTIPVATETRGVSCQIDSVPNPIKTRTVSTHTRLKNIRKPIGYCESPPKVCHNIKKEAFENQFETLVATSEHEINPQLTQLWIILGKLLFGLIGNGQIFNNSTTTASLGQTWQQIQEISELIEARTLQRQELREAYLRQHVSKGIRIEESNEGGKNSFEREVDDDQGKFFFIHNFMQEF